MDESTWKACTFCGGIVDETELTHLIPSDEVLGKSDLTYLDLIGDDACKKCLKDRS